LSKARNRQGARALVGVLAVDRLADGDGRGRCGALGGWDRSAYASGVAYEGISIDPNRMGGLPCIRDTRVTVRAVLGQFAGGLTIPELLVINGRTGTVTSAISVGFDPVGVAVSPRTGKIYVTNYEDGTVSVIG
jgi:hypothetical protein